MSIVIDNAQQPPSTATTVPLSSNSSKEPDDSHTSTHLERTVGQKVAADRRLRDSRASSAVLKQCELQSQYLHGENKMVQFKGLYVVQGPTESKHVRYTMDIAVAELQLQGRCIQRFRSFFLLRKRLLEVLKTCRGRLLSRKSTLTGDPDEPQGSAGAELIELLARPRCIQCPECELSYDELAAVKFPRRTLLPPSLQDIQARSQMLETFLEYCVRIATTVSACQRTKRLFTTALGKFLGVDVLAGLATLKEGNDMSETRSVDSVDTVEGGEQLDEANKLDKSCKKDSGLPSVSHQVDENMQWGGDYEGGRHSEPNFSFISHLAKRRQSTRS
uniref:PX domain-containing protein n=1 Tax=Hyaloperonospora arabidopsidis (strain Emoy2) TaxID=559515 RepID=M4BEN4_HYAAE